MDLKDNSMHGIKWWEKTVEYHFVFNLMSNKKLFLAPLDGQEESAGDLAMGIAEKWMLIEFKKDSKAIKSEQLKYENYNETKTKFLNRDAHHHLVFGYDSSSNETGAKPTLSITGCTYFGWKQKTMEEILISGVDLKVFKQYITDLTKEKKTTASSGGISAESFGIVAGVSASGDVVECKSMREFCLEHGLEKLLEQSHEKQISREGPEL